MTPKELYNLVCTLKSAVQVPSICYVEKNCFSRGFCTSAQSTPIINFDEVKDLYYNGFIGATPASVDAIAIGSKGTTFCFVELKGWKNYIVHQTRQKKTITETVGGYNLSGKLADSQTLCIDLSKDPDLFAHMPVRFILVTDIDPDANGIEYIHDMLTALGETTTEMYSQCVSEAKKGFDSEIHIDKVYIQCRNFDNYLKNI